MGSVERSFRINLFQQIFGKDHDGPVRGADVLQDLNRLFNTYLFVGTRVTLKIASSRKEFLLYFSKK